MTKPEVRSSTSISIRSSRIDLPQEFCDRYVKENKFAGLYWDAEKEELGIAFHTLNSNTASCIPIAELPDRAYSSIYCAKFCRRALHQHKIQRYSVTGVDVIQSGTVIFKFKLERRLP